MLVLAVITTVHWFTALSQVSPNDPLSQQVLARVANPLLTSAQFLIPAAVGISGLHKMMEHRAGSRWPDDEDTGLPLRRQRPAPASTNEKDATSAWPPAQRSQIHRA